EARARRGARRSACRRRTAASGSSPRRRRATRTAAARRGTVAAPPATRSGRVRSLTPEAPWAAMIPAAHAAVLRRAQKILLLRRAPLQVYGERRSPRAALVRGADGQRAATRDERQVEPMDAQFRQPAGEDRGRDVEPDEWAQLQRRERE